MIRNPSEPFRCALIVGHPGHELRILGWVNKMHPSVVSLTDGSGHAMKHDRLAISKSLLERSGAAPSSLFGMVSDAEIYKRILAQDHDFFLELAKSIADLLIDLDTELVAGDAIEGYNPSHDICRLIIELAVRIASKHLGHAIINYAFPLIGHPSLEGSLENGMMIELSAPELAFKLSESQKYAEEVGGVMAEEIAVSLTNYGENAFAKEFFHCENIRAALAYFENEQPYYELYGEKQVKAGLYKQTIKYREHIAPLARTLLP